jgi:hypothetical protein
VALRHRANKRFWQEYRTLPEDVRKSADKQFSLLKKNPQHPSLLFKKVGDRSDGRELWSARVTLNYRALAIKRTDGFVWFWVGRHGIYDSMIS